MLTVQCCLVSLGTLAYNRVEFVMSTNTSLTLTTNRRVNWHRAIHLTIISLTSRYLGNTTVYESGNNMCC